MANKLYQEIDFASLLYGDTISTAEALADVEPIRWPESVLIISELSRKGIPIDRIIDNLE